MYLVRTYLEAGHAPRGVVGDGVKGRSEQTRTFLDRSSGGHPRRGTKGPGRKNLPGLLQSIHSIFVECCRCRCRCRCRLRLRLRLTLSRVLRPPSPSSSCPSSSPSRRRPVPLPRFRLWKASSRCIAPALFGGRYVSFGAFELPLSCSEAFGSRHAVPPSFPRLQKTSSRCTAPALLGGRYVCFGAF